MQMQSPQIDMIYITPGRDVGSSGYGLTTVPVATRYALARCLQVGHWPGDYGLTTGALTMGSLLTKWLWAKYRLSSSDSGSDSRVATVEHRQYWHDRLFCVADL